MNPFREKSELNVLWNKVSKIEGPFTTKILYEKIEGTDAYKAAMMLSLFCRKGLIKFLGTREISGKGKRQLNLYEVNKP